MLPSSNIFLQETLGALQATVSVLLILLFGSCTVKYLRLVDQRTIDGVTKLSTNIFLPCMLFTEMGKESSWSQLKQYWVLPVFTLAFTCLSLLYATLGVRVFKLPNWVYPAAAFPNMLSLPLLLIESLGKSGAMDKLLMGDRDTLDKAIARGRVYILVNVGLHVTAASLKLRIRSAQLTVALSSVIIIIIIIHILCLFTSPPAMQTGPGREYHTIRDRAVSLA